ncbi:BREX-2 system adenine-specific DNA-methyltransferase PglX [Sorangium sp. So ce394]|uniref:BREX-2 system adenine-specific DNA-methyltransferase PglX n=1 Tax=Sorangium sp. So ce394 TaxID=3133310 RepID=UPI003F5BEAD3
MAARKTKAPRKTKTVERNLTRELSALLAKTLLPDLKERARPENVREALRERWAQERKEHRTADDFDDWIPRTLEQIGVAWILSCVFVRTLEDRGYLTHARIAGEGAADAEELFFRLFPSLSVRDYLLAVFRELSHAPGGDDVLGPRHNPAWQLAPGVDATRQLLEFFRETDASGELVWKFGGTDTRFLGDLYQDVSEGVRERFALLQTPEFVEEFILDLTLEPAIKEYGLTEVRLIDPTCGSGHFLLGAFKRIFEARQRKAPGLPPKEHAGAALAQVYGVDLNPYAVAIARFRLVLAYLEAAGIGKLKDAPRVPVNLVVADSLLHGAKDANRGLWEVKGDAAAWGEDAFQLEDPEGAERILGQRYHAVVGNPPYITCKDSELRDLYRSRYRSCYREYALAAPFTERFFQLATDGGYTGLINANSFMKREFGKKLIEDVLPEVELSRVVDTSGAYIPGHGTPTVLLFGRNRKAIAATVRAVLGKRGEPSTPTEPKKGLVWSSIESDFDNITFENEFVSVADVPRETFDKHPWSLGGGGAAGLKGVIETRATTRLEDLGAEIGFGAVTREDEVYLVGEGALDRARIPVGQRRRLVAGEDVRDWSMGNPTLALWPYDPTTLRAVGDDTTTVIRLLWPYRRQLSERVAYGQSQIKRGLAWFEYSMFFADRFKTPYRITFAFVATHNHFVLDRGSNAFKQSAPIIKLPENATEEDHLALLAYLNSSTACFWMKQVSHNKGSGADAGNRQPERAKFRFEFSATQIAGMPLPDLSTAKSTLAQLAQEAETIAARRAECAWADDILERHRSTDTTHILERIGHAETEHETRLQKLIFLQEYMDWTAYASFGLAPIGIVDQFRNVQADGLPRVPLGARPFECLLARRGSKVGIDGQTLVAELPTSWPSPMKRLWEECIKHIISSPHLALIEGPEHKRRWVVTPKDGGGDVLTFADQSKASFRKLALDRLERFARLNAAPKVESGRKIGAMVAADPSANSAIEVHSKLLGGEAQLVIGSLIESEAVPYLAALRYTEAGLEKRVAWEHTWALQRREDAGEKDLQIPVPPKYDSKDFRDPTFWRLRGKLDVPKERFISYPGAEKDDDPSPLFGWAGWDHLEQATALAALYLERKQEDGWPADRLVPLLAGLLELVPWLKQWHNEPREDFGGERLGDYYERYVEAEARALGKTLDDLRAWRPAGRRGRK